MDEKDQNQNPGMVEALEVQVMDVTTNDMELVVLRETGPNTGIFAPVTPLYTKRGTAVPSDGLLQTQIGSTVLGYYADPDLPKDHCYAGTVVTYMKAIPILVKEMPL